MTAKILITVLGVVLIILVNWYFLFSKKKILAKKKTRDK